LRTDSYTHSPMKAISKSVRRRLPKNSP
jgi:hypothetical protein